MHKHILIILFLFNSINGMSRVRTKLKPLLRSAQRTLSADLATLLNVRSQKTKRLNNISFRQFATEAEMSQMEAYALFNLKPYNIISDKQLHKLFLSQAQHFHPDKNKKNGLEDYAHSEFLRREKAYQVILKHQKLLNDGTETNLYEHNIDEIIASYANDYKMWTENIEYQKYKFEQDQKAKKENEERAERRRSYKKAAYVSSALLGTGAYVWHLKEKQKNENYINLVKNGSIEELRKLLTDPDFNPNITDSNRISGFTWACLLGHLEIVKLYLSDKRFIRFNEAYGSTTPLGNAIAANQKNVVELLLEDSRIEISFFIENKIDDEMFALIWNGLKKRTAKYYEKTNDLEEFNQLYDLSQNIDLHVYFKNKVLFKKCVAQYKIISDSVLLLARNQNDYELLFIALNNWSHCFDRQYNYLLESNFDLMFAYYIGFKKVQLTKYGNYVCFLEYIVFHELFNFSLEEFVKEKYCNDGNTVWHYLVKYSEKYEASSMNKFVNECIKLVPKDLCKKNNRGLTARQMAQKEKNLRMVNLLEFLERKHVDQNIKDPKASPDIKDIKDLPEEPIADGPEIVYEHGGII